MKKLAVLMAMGVLLSGCEMSYERYTALIERCEALGGTPIVFKTKQGAAYKIRCEINDTVFLQGDF